MYVDRTIATLIMTSLPDQRPTNMPTHNWRYLEKEEMDMGTVIWLMVMLDYYVGGGGHVDQDSAGLGTHDGCV